MAWAIVSGRRRRFGRPSCEEIKQAKQIVRAARRRRPDKGRARGENPRREPLFQHAFIIERRRATGCSPASSAGDGEIAIGDRRGGKQREGADELRQSRGLENDAGRGEDKEFTVVCLAFEKRAEGGVVEGQIALTAVESGADPFAALLSLETGDAGVKFSFADQDHADF